MHERKQIARVKNDAVAFMLAPTGEQWKDVEIGRFLVWCDSSDRGHGIDSLREYTAELLSVNAPRTVERKLSAIKAGYAAACRDSGKPAGWLDDVFRELRKKIPEIQPEPPKIITRSQYRSMIRGLPAHKFVFFRALWETGARVDELCKCRRSSCSERRGHVELSIIGKGNKIRTIILSNELYGDILHAYPLRGEFLFHGLLPRNGVVGNLSRKTAWRWVSEAGRRIGLDFSLHPHTFRHTYATRLFESDIALPIVQRMLGHSKLDTTMIYTHLQLPVLHILEASR